MAVEDAGSIEAELRLKLTQMQKDALQAQKNMDALAAKFKKQGASAGDGFASGMKQGFDRTEAYAAKMGKSIATKLSPVIIGITAGIKAIQGIGKALGDAFMANEKFANGISELKSHLGASFTAAVRPVTDWFSNIIDKAAKSVREAKELEEVLERIRTGNFAAVSRDAGEAIRQTTSSMETLHRAYLEARNKFEDLQRRVERDGRSSSNVWSQQLVREMEAAQQEMFEASDRYNEAIRRWQEVRLETGNATPEQMDAHQEMVKELLLAEKVIDEARERGIIDEQAANEARISALNNYINKANEFAARENINNSIINNEIEKQIAKRNEYIELTNKEKSTQEKITEAREKAIERYEQEVRRVSDARKAGLIDEEAEEKQLHAALSQKYSDLEAIVTQYQLTTGETIRLRDETAKLVKEYQDITKEKLNQERIDEIQLEQGDTLRQQEIDVFKAKAAAAKTDVERNAALMEAIRLENELIDIQRKRAWEAIEKSEEYIAASKKVKKEILDDFKKITAGMKKVMDEAEEGGSFLERLFGSEEYGLIQQMGSASVDFYDSISNTALEISRRYAEEQLAIIEKSLEETLESIEKAREAELIAAGFAVRNNTESFEAQLEAAKRTGDEVLIYLAERRLKEQQINDEYNRRAEEAEKEAARKKAEIEHKIAVQEHANQMIGAVNAGIMAVLQALAAAPPPYNFILAGLSGTATTIQIGLLAANPPQPPKFANSGIVPGNKYSGDRNLARVDSGELILNRAHQDNIANQLTSNSGPVTATIVVMMDTREIAKSTVELVNDGFYTIKARAVRE